MKLRRILIALVVVLVAIQFYRPETTNPVADPSASITAQMDVPADVASILERSCYDCHSHGTDWPWYAQVAPMSWLCAKDVNDGRRHLNFSRWAEYPPSKVDIKLEEIAKEVGEGEMPLEIYLPLHSDARLSDADRQAVVEWAEGAKGQQGVPGGSR